MLTNEIGTLKWINKTGGRLSWHNRLTLVRQAVSVRLKAKFQRRHSILPLDLQDITPPDSAITRAALAICMDASPDFLTNHCLRAYYFARLFNRHGHHFDDEVLYTATLLHDLGLTQRYRVQDGECFTLAGARVAESLGAEHQWPDRRIRLAAEAITLHLNVSVPPKQGIEAHLLRLGTVADVTGSGLSSLPTSTVDELVKRVPRLSLKKGLIGLINHDVRQCPDCRMAFLQEKVQITRLVQAAPMFAE